MSSDDNPMAPDNTIADLDRDDEPVEVDEEQATVRNIETLENKVKKLQGEAVEASERGDPETLSTLLLRLARCNSALGRQAAYANYLARNADRAARRYRGERVLHHSQSMAVNKAEPNAELDAKDLFSTASEVLLLAEQASDLCFRTDTFLKMAQSRLSLIKGDAARG